MYKLSNRRYTGSKAQLTDWIMSLILANCEGRSFLDLFAGTGVVAAAAAAHYDHVYVNDFLYSNYAAYMAFFEKGAYNLKKLKDLEETYNNFAPANLDDDYFAASYGGKYFSLENAKLIGAIREDIERHKHELSKKEYWILITSLVYSADKISNTVGHYDAFFSTIREPKKFAFSLVEPNSQNKFSIYREDANKLIRKLSADIVYIDPPYNSRQYSRFYHVLENLVTWKKPELFGVARKPTPENMSEYSKVGAKDALTDLINNLHCRYAVVSYNNTYNSKSSSSRNKITLEEIKEILNSRGETNTFSKSHKHFNSGRTKFDDHREYLFILKVNGKSKKHAN